jgi:group I intron endonuclease
MRFPSEKVVGIYKIINTINDKYYVGSSSFISKRWASHRSYLNRNVHANDYLQNSWNKYKEEGFVFLVIEKLPIFTTDEELLMVEQKYLDIAKSEPDKCYNLNFVANNPNSHLSEYSKQKRSESLKRVIKTKEWKQKISRSHVGIRHSNETKEKLKKIMTGRKQSDSQKNNATESRRKNWEFFSPGGNVIKIHDLKRFCKENKLHLPSMYSVFYGKRKTHKGWMSENSKNAPIKKRKCSRYKHYLFISPSNEIVNIQNLKEFCIVNGLNQTCMYDIHSEKKYRHTHKRWRKA